MLQIACTIFFQNNNVFPQKIKTETSTHCKLLYIFFSVKKYGTQHCDHCQQCGTRLGACNKQCGIERVNQSALGCRSILIEVQASDMMPSFQTVPVMGSVITWKAFLLCSFSVTFDTPTISCVSDQCTLDNIMIYLRKNLVQCILLRALGKSSLCHLILLPLAVSGINAHCTILWFIKEQIWYNVFCSEFWTKVLSPVQAYHAAPPTAVITLLITILAKTTPWREDKEESFSF